MSDQASPSSSLQDLAQTVRDYEAGLADGRAWAYRADAREHTRVMQDVLRGATEWSASGLSLASLRPPDRNVDRAPDALSSAHAYDRGFVAALATTPVAHRPLDHEPTPELRYDDPRDSELS